MEEKRKLWCYENGVLIMLFFAVGLVFFDRLAIMFLFPMIASDLHLNNTQLGLLASALGLTWAISGPILGLTADSLGRKKVVFIMLILLFSTFSLLSGLVAGFVSLLIFRMIMGVAEGPVLPIAQSVMAVESSESRRGFNMGFIQSTAASVLGGILAPLIIVGIATAYGWREAFYFTIIPGLVMALIIGKYLREPQKKERISPELSSDTEDTSKMTFFDVVKHRNIWLATLIACSNLTWYILMVTFTPNYLVTIREMSPSLMSLVITGLGIGGAIWGFGAPAISDRIGRKPALIIFAIISTLSPFAILYFNGSAILFTLVLIIVHCGQGCTPIFMSTIVAESIPVKFIAASVGLIMGVGEVVGGVIAPVIAGRAADIINPASPFFIAAGGAIITAILSMFVIETAPVRLKTKQSVTIT